MVKEVIIKSRKSNLTLADISKIEVKLKNFLVIREVDYSIDLSKSSISCFIGKNGSGKSIFLSVLGTLLRPSHLKDVIDYQVLSDDAQLKFSFYCHNGERVSFIQEGKSIGNWTGSNDSYYFKKGFGFFEPAIDSPVGVRKVKKPMTLLRKNYSEIALRKVPDELSRAMNYILYGRYSGKFDLLCRIDDKANITDTNFFLKFDKNVIIPQHQFSTGEFFLLNMLKHFIRTANAKNKELSRFIIIDELEISLHPYAQTRLIEYLINFIDERNQKDEKPNIVVLFSTHSYDILRKIVSMGKEDMIFLFDAHDATRKAQIRPLKILNKKDPKLGQLVNSILLPVKYFTECQYQYQPKVLIIEDDEIYYVIEALRSLGFIEDFRSGMYEKQVFIIKAGGCSEVIGLAEEIESIGDITGFREILVVLDGDVNDEELRTNANIEIVKLPIESTRKYILTLLRENGEVREQFLQQILGPLCARELLKNKEWFLFLEEIEKLDKLNSNSAKRMWKTLIKVLRTTGKYCTTGYDVDTLIEQKLIEFVVKKENHKFKEFASKIKEFLTK